MPNLPFPTNGSGRFSRVQEISGTRPNHHPPPATIDTSGNARRRSKNDWTDNRVRRHGAWRRTTLTTDRLGRKCYSADTLLTCYLTRQKTPIERRLNEIYLRTGRTYTLEYGVYILRTRNACIYIFIYVCVSNAIIIY